MSAEALRLVTPRPLPPAAPAPSVRTLGRRLVERGVLSPWDLARAEALLERREVRLPEVLLAHRMVTEADLTTTLALHWGAGEADLDVSPPDVRLIDALGWEACLTWAVLPWLRAGSETVVAVARPEEFELRRPELERALGPVRLAVASERAIQAALARTRQRRMAQRAETLVPEIESCRGRTSLQLARLVTGLGVVIALGSLVALQAALAVLVVWAVLTLLATTGLKIAALVAQMRPRPKQEAPAVTSIARQPTVSLLVPLFKEREVAGRLIDRLARLDYPRELLDICLVVEQDDTITQQALAATRLPSWMRQIMVPRGNLQTKPRALNYALGFCRGSIVGVYDAEDKPAPDQIRIVVDRFAAAGPDVACLQGVLDFYNPRDNWISRCFAIEYATWFRVVLPGLARLGLVVPLGGTTLFVRRDALECLGGWDAHNVTEDADLGVRLARHGYRTELIETATLEEANCRMLPWIRQRSRWLKGYAMTYAVHMRDPVRLWRDLGTKRFLGVQVVFLGTLSQFVLAPLLWSFWLLAATGMHPFSGAPVPVVLALLALFLVSELVGIAAAVYAVSERPRRWLVPWVPFLHIYFPLGALAMYKALWEVVIAPFYWDKTQHGHSIAAPPAVTAADRRIPAPPRRPSAG